MQADPEIDAMLMTCIRVGERVPTYVIKNRANTVLAGREPTPGFNRLRLTTSFVRQRLDAMSRDGLVKRVYESRNCVEWLKPNAPG